ncbi:MAG: shikimate dehydrogenase [Candidatus Dormibacteraeota bacterium]|nr:shikimate dehydrogenase [Candidatus Dormibacteraeota bacterium]
MDTVPHSETVSRANLAAAITRMRTDDTVLGAAVMRPHTVAVTPMLDGLGPEVQSVRAVNVISHRGGGLVGWNTDRPAFAQALEDAGYQPRGRSALIVGAGGAARAAGDALRTQASRVFVAAQDLEEARSLCYDLDITSGGPTPLGSLSLVVPKVDLIVNATPIGSDGESHPFPIEWVTPTQFLFDLVYDPPVTPLVRGARARGARAINGLTMLLYQGLAAFEIWTGTSAPEPAMRAGLQRAIVSRLAP